MGEPPRSASAVTARAAAEGGARASRKAARARAAQRSSCRSVVQGNGRSVTAALSRSLVAETRREAAVSRRARGHGHSRLGQAPSQAKSMRGSHLSVLLSLGALACAMSLAPSAAADPPKKTPAGSSARSKPKDDAAAKLHRQFLDAIKDGSTKYVAKDVAGAIEAFTGATEARAAQPAGVLLPGRGARREQGPAAGRGGMVEGCAGCRPGKSIAQGQGVLRHCRPSRAPEALGRCQGCLAAVCRPARHLPGRGDVPAGGCRAHRRESRPCRSRTRPTEIVRKRIAEEKAAKASGTTPPAP